MRTDLPLLASVLDTLLPPFDGVAGAGQLGLASAVSADAESSRRFVASVRTVLAALPAVFLSLPPNERAEALRSVERSDPVSFTDLINLAYTAYYSDARVLALIERRTGYKSAPPQPGGYVLEPFDDHLLDGVRARSSAGAHGATWRPAPK